MDANALIDQYLEGPKLLRQAVEGMSNEQLDARPVPGKWSTRQVVCHIADFESVYADRMKHVIAEDKPALRGGFQDQFAEHLAYDRRDLEEELRIVESVRNQIARILRTLPAEAFERVGIHSEDGPLTLRTLIERITGHIPHHVKYIEEKRNAMK